LENYAPPLPLIFRIWFGMRVAEMISEFCGRQFVDCQKGTRHMATITLILSLLIIGLLACWVGALKVKVHFLQRQISAISDTVTPRASIPPGRRGKNAAVQATASGAAEAPRRMVTTRDDGCGTLTLG
jgi:hypothetical protein